MHWSRSSHRNYEECPRKFFYEAIAAPRNPEIAALKDRRSGPLVRHEVVRKAVIHLTKTRELDEQMVDAEINKAKGILSASIKEVTAVLNGPGFRR